ncbi:hypothetical protein [Winogradskyella endarachnes]|uniref:DUF4870 domain-containing protein n=1 Tax=Winogradskyella endarachnes TaxID=2681965 RepID=A0A6L6U8Y8_9FLAO|nr:hypothetical protein [Winogradskyella endarachnes]MUU77304.1 hypothetical protein [Winogradskyella endarachnes]
MNQNTIDEGKTLGLVAYLTLLGTLIAFFMNQDKKNPFTAFHIRQGLGLGILYTIIAFVVSSMDSMMVSMSFWVFFSILYFYGLIGAISGKMNKIPLIGDVFQNIFKSIGQ